MMIMKRYFLTLIAALCTLTMWADSAKDVLDKAVAQIEKANGLEAKFSLEAFKQNSSLGTTTGTIQMKGEKFRIQTAEATTWYNGKTQWSYQKKSDEVTITTPTTRELESINPYRLLSLYKSGYSYKLLSVKKYKSLAVNAVELTATDKKRSFRTIVVYINKNANLPVFISVTMRDGTRNDITIGSSKTGTRPSDSTFAFNKKDYPKAEVIDLR